MSIAIDNPAPRRPRRRAFTPVTGGLAAVILAAGGFIGGVQLQKSQATTSTPSFPGGQLPAGIQGGGPPGGAATSDAATTGTVEYTKGNVLYVKDSDGNTIKVKLKSSSDVTRTAAADGDAVEPGDNVVVQGETNANGTVTASAVTATE
ncbi:hypothetical protein [Solirubrobacter soli]|uniref:hypothetical protein n=1 Tax=Solirubrobacter soli TaxID=363832 RepID=UPI0004207CB9|nr:hypothetical protein [Solirubrobacter soli]